MAQREAECLAGKNRAGAHFFDDNASALGVRGVKKRQDFTNNSTFGAALAAGKISRPSANF